MPIVATTAFGEHDVLFQTVGGILVPDKIHPHDMASRNIGEPHILAFVFAHMLIHHRAVALLVFVVAVDVGDTFLYLREGITGYELSGEERRDVEMLKRLCDKSYDERLKLKQCCAGDRTFALEKYESKFDEFLKAVSVQ